MITATPQRLSTLAERGGDYKKLPSVFLHLQATWFLRIVFYFSFFGGKRGGRVSPPPAMERESLSPFSANSSSGPLKPKMHKPDRPWYHFVRSLAKPAATSLLHGEATTPLFPLYFSKGFL